jgi:hypothetical protein
MFGLDNPSYQSEEWLRSFGKLNQLNQLSFNIRLKKI